MHITDYDALSCDPVYLATKAGLQSMTRSLTTHFALRIKANSIVPELIMFDSPEHKQHVLAQSLVGVEPGSEVFYRVLVYIFENPYITGTCLNLNDGGRIKYA